MKLECLDFLDVSEMLSDEEIMVQKTTKDFCLSEIKLLVTRGLHRVYLPHMLCF